MLSVRCEPFVLGLKFIHSLGGSGGGRDSEGRRAEGWAGGGGQCDTAQGQAGCPIDDCIILAPTHPETVDELQAKYERLTADT